MRRLFTLSKSLLRIHLRNRTALFWNFAFPIGLIALYGTLWGGEDFGGVGAITWLAVGVVVLNIMSSGFIADASWLTTIREQGILMRVQATPLPTPILVTAYVLVRLLLVLLQAAAIIAVAALGFGAQFSLLGLAAALGIGAFGAAVFIALGQAIAAIAPTGGAAAAIGQALYFPLMFVSNLFVPTEGLPGWIVSISRWTPAYMLVDLMRPAMVPVPAGQPLWVNLAGLAIYGALGMGLASWLFRWEPRR
jgi:ABC-2 type transport system permease protein